MSKNNSMSVIVRTMSNILFSFIIVYGLFIIVNGHLTPGGGFQGGVIIASSMVLLFVAHGKKIKNEIFNKKIFAIIESGGALAFIGIGFFGIGTAFFYNVILHDKILFFGEAGTLFSAGGIMLMNIAVGIKVFAGITTAVFLLGLFEDISIQRVEDISNSKNEIEISHIRSECTSPIRSEWAIENQRFSHTHIRSECAIKKNGDS